MPFLFLNLAAQENYTAIHWGADNGLTHDIVNCMIKDVNGFLWLGTDFGLNRFDGNSFKSYFNDKIKNRKIGNIIVSLVKDSLNNIWMGSEDYGISRYDIKTDTFANFLPAKTNKTPDLQTIPFWATKDEIFCVESGSRIITYNIHSFVKKELVKLTLDDPRRNSATIPHAIFDATSKSIWMLTGPPEQSVSELLAISLSTGQRQHYRWPCYKKIAGHNHFTEAMCYDKRRNSIWINSPDGLLEFTFHNRKFRRVDALNDLVQLKDYNRWVGIDMDRNGRVWFATQPKGIFIYDPSTETIKLPFGKNPGTQTEVSQFNFSIYCDSDGITWSSFWLKKGIFQIVPFSNIIKHFVAEERNKNSVGDNLILNAIKGSNGELWFGSKNEINILEADNKTFKILKEKDLPGVKGQTIVPSVIDTNINKVLLYTDSGLFVMNITYNTCKPIIFRDSLNKVIRHVWLPRALYGSWGSYKNGCIVIGRDNLKTRVYTITGDLCEAHEILSFPFDFQINMEGTITVNNKYLFISKGNSSEVIVFLNEQNRWKAIKSPFGNIPVKNIFFNKDDESYWIGGETQLLHFNKDFRLIRSYSPENGLPIYDIYSLIDDNEGNIWFDTDRQIFKLNIITGKIIPLSEKDGLQKIHFTPGTYIIKNKAGNLYLPGGVFGKGIMQITPLMLKENYPPSKVYFQSLEINQKPFANAAGINSIPAINLQYFENNISIQTGIIDYYSHGQGNNRIRYMLQGIETSWQYAPANYIIRYVGLSAGNYKLFMQASNVVGEWNGPQKILSITVKPAFWNTRWFRSLIIISVLALVYGFMRFKWKQKLKLQNEQTEKEKIRAEMRYKTAELEMQALRAQMNPHFIFNCLNAINYFIINQESETAANYLIKFSRLIPTVLNNSQRPFIPLEDELETLQLYVDLEKLRFKNSFDYISTCSSKIDTANTCIPSLILQPFVENAIWHGLMHKETKGKLEIDITLENELLCCTISDNGIGRSNAAMIKSAAAEKIKSMGLNITKSRIDLINGKTKEQQYFLIHDLVDDAGKPKGTMVVLKIKFVHLDELHN